MTLTWTIIGSVITFAIFILSIPLMGLAVAGVGMSRQGNKVEKKLVLPFKVSAFIFIFSCTAPLWTIALAWLFYANDFSSNWYWCFLIPYPTFVIGLMLQDV